MNSGFWVTSNVRMSHQVNRPISPLSPRSTYLSLCSIIEGLSSEKCPVTLGLFCKYPATQNWHICQNLSEITAIHKSCIMTLLNLLMNNLKTDTVCHIRIIFPELMHKDATIATHVSDGQCCLFAKNSSMHNTA